MRGAARVDRLLIAVAGSARPGPPATLITIPISHFCEKARWALDRCGVAYRERAHLQVLHVIAARRAGGGRTVPVLVCGDGVLGDSSLILDHADRRAPGPEWRLYPEEPDEAAEIRALERELDEGLGPHGRRWMYHGVAARREIARRYAPAGVPAWERAALPLALPVLSRVIDRILDITPATAAASLVEVRRAFDRIGERLSDGRPYLAGERFTAADLTFSALAAAVLMPPQYGVPIPRPDELPAPMAATVRDLREHPAGRHALRMFATERRLRPTGTYAR